MIASATQPGRAWAVVTVVLTTVALFVVVAVATCAGPEQPPVSSVTTGAPTSTPVPGHSGATATLGPPAPVATRVPVGGGPVAPPPTGALLGAWVKPATLTQTERVVAVDQFERQLGRKLDIVNTYRRFGNPFFTESDRRFISDGSTLMLSWAGGDTREVSSGIHDALLRTRAKAVAALDTPILIRYRWEMDRPNLRAQTHSGADFIASWRHVRAIFAAAGADNVSWVWCPTAEGFTQGYAPDFYPGDDQVDWVCVDAYAGLTFAPLEQVMASFLRWAADHPRPIMIGEFGVARGYPSADRIGWLTDATKMIKANPQIKAACYFESDSSRQLDLQQFQLRDDESALDAFAELAHDPYFNVTG